MIRSRVVLNEKGRPAAAGRPTAGDRLPPAAFLVVLGGAIMQRSRQRVFDHFGFFEVGESRVQLLEVVENLVRFSTGNGKNGE